MNVPFRLSFALVALSASLAAHAGTATYLFANSYAPQEATAPNLGVYDPLSQNLFTTDTIYGATRNVYRTAGVAGDYIRNAGLTLDASSVIGATSYSLEMVVLVSTNTANGFEKLADVSNRVSDTGYYVYNQRLDVYNLGNGITPVTVGTYNYLALTVDGGTLKGYVNGALDFTFTGSSIMDGTAFNFFVDDDYTSGREYSDVSVGLLRLTNGLLSDAEVARRSVNPYAPVPEPTTLAALGLGAFAASRRRRRA